MSSEIFEFPEIFLNTCSVSAHGGLLLCMFAVTHEGMLALIANSQNLLTLHIVGAFNVVLHYRSHQHASLLSYNYRDYQKNNFKRCVSHIKHEADY